VWKKRGDFPELAGEGKAKGDLKCRKSNTCRGGGKFLIKKRVFTKKEPKSRYLPLLGERPSQTEKEVFSVI